jgi:hypothetical protein
VNCFIDKYPTSYANNIDGDDDSDDAVYDDVGASGD